MPRQAGIPQLRRHRASGQGVVTLSREDIYLGTWPASEAEAPSRVRSAYDQAIQEWPARGRRPRRTTTTAESGAVVAGAGGLFVVELVNRYLDFAERHYRPRPGARTNELGNIKGSLRPLLHLYGRTLASEFGPKSLKAVRELMIAGYEHPRHGPQPALVRKQINGRVGRIIRCFKWAAEEELIPALVWHALRSVRGLEAGPTLSRGRTSNPWPTTSLPRRYPNSTRPCSQWCCCNGSPAPGPARSPPCASARSTPAALRGSTGHDTTRPPTRASRGRSPLGRGRRSFSAITSREGRWRSGLHEPDRLAVLDELLPARRPSSREEG
jgi:hypothetical protein